VQANRDHEDLHLRKTRKDEVKFDACADMNKPDHEVKEVELGSSRLKEACGEYGCARCGAGGAATQ